MLLEYTMTHGACLDTRLRTYLGALLIYATVQAMLCTQAWCGALSFLEWRRGSDWKRRTRFVVCFAARSGIPADAPWYNEEPGCRQQSSVALIPVKNHKVRASIGPL